MVNITSQVCNEVYDIIYNMETELFNKIPKVFINILEKNRDINFNSNIDYSKSINEQELQRETRIILSLIYRDYLCSENERKKLIEQDNAELRQLEQELYEKYNPDNLFKNKQNVNIEQQELQLIKYEKINFLTKIINKIKKILKRR